MKLALLLIISLYSNLALSCACCGLDDTWNESTVEYPNYPLDIVPKLELIDGYFDDSMRAEYWIEIKSIELVNNRYILRTDLGDIIFVFNKESNYKEADITFITNKDYRSSNVADIYREIILTGTLTFPQSIIDKAKVENLQLTQDAKLILQGIGNMCIDEDDFQKWIIKVEDVNFTGAGSIKSIHNKSS